MGSPLVIDVADVLRAQGAARTVTQHGASGQHIGLDMVFFAPTSELTVNAALTPLGGAVLVDATVSGTVTGQCSRCLSELHGDYSLSVSEVFSDDPDFIVGDATDDEEGSPGRVERGYVDLTDAVINKAGLELPFNPVCEDYGQTCDTTSVPPPDGVSGEQAELVDPRWAGLERFR